MHFFKGDLLIFAVLSQS